MQSLQLREDLGVCVPAASCLLMLNGSESPWLGAVSCKPHAGLLALGHHVILSQSLEPYDSSFAVSQLPLAVNFLKYACLLHELL